MPHKVAEVPVAAFALLKQVVKPTSNNPAIINSNQFIYNAICKKTMVLYLALITTIYLLTAAITSVLSGEIAGSK